MSDLDSRIAALNEWQQSAYRLIWAVATGSGVVEASRLREMSKERPEEYAVAEKVWEEIMLEVCY